MKRLHVLLLICALTLGFAVLHADPAQCAIKIKIAGMKPEGEPETVAMHSFGKHLETLSKGKYEVQVFPNSMLGKEDAYIANTRKGIIQMCATGTQTLSTGLKIVPRARAHTIPHGIPIMVTQHMIIIPIQPNALKSPGKK